MSGVTESVLVSAAQVEIPLSQASSTVTVISDAEIQARQLHSLADVLRGVPGLAVASTGGTGAVTGVFPRGGESNFTLVFVDDVPVTAFGGEYDFAHLSTANVERIEVVRGPQSALFGSNAIGAVVRVDHPARRCTDGLGAASKGADTGPPVSRAPRRVRPGASSGARRANGWRATVITARARRPGSSWKTTTTSAPRDRVTAGWRDRGVSVRAQLRHATDERGVPGPFGTNPIGAFTAIDTISRGRNDETVAGLSIMLPLGNRVRAGVQTAYHRLASDFSSPFGPSESSSKRWSGRAQFDMPLAAALDLSAGLELQRERAGSTFITDPVSFEPVPVERTIAGYFAEARWAAARAVSVTAGVRLDDIRRESLALLPEDDVVSINPKGAVTWVVGPGSSAPTRVRAAASTGIRPPGAFDLGFTDNPSLKPERSRSAEIGVHQGFANGRAAVEAVGFVNEFDDLIVAVGSFRESSRYTTDNISNARARGLEVGLSAGHRLGGRRAVDLRGRVSYTLVDSEILAVDRDNQAPPPFSVGEPLVRRPRHQVFAEATAAAGPLTLFASGGARSRVLDVEPSFGTFGGLHYAAASTSGTSAAHGRSGGSPTSTHGSRTSSTNGTKRRSGFRRSDGAPSWGCGLLRAADLRFDYGEAPVLDGVSLEVPSRGFVGIIGPNGSGKTSLLRLLAGTRRPQAGTITFDGVPLASLRRGDIARRMAVVPQETHLAFEYTVLEVVLMGRYPHLGAFEIEGPRDLELARRALAATGTLTLEGRPFNTLSGARSSA